MMACATNGQQGYPAEAVAAAARWWAAELGGTPPTPGSLTELVARKVPFADEDRDRFRAALETSIAEHLRDCPGCVGMSHGRHNVRMGYDPDAVLRAAAEKAGIELLFGDLSRKTAMIFEEGAISVSEGYGAPYGTVWAGG